MRGLPGFLTSTPLGRWETLKVSLKNPKDLPRIEPGTSGVTVSDLTNRAIAPPLKDAVTLTIENGMRDPKLTIVGYLL